MGAVADVYCCAALLELKDKRRLGVCGVEMLALGVLYTPVAEKPIFSMCQEPLHFLRRTKHKIKKLLGNTQNAHRGGEKSWMSSLHLPPGSVLGWRCKDILVA